MSEDTPKGKPQPVKTVKSSRDIVGVLQTYLVGHARKTGKDLSESDLAQLLGDLWLDLEIARTPADDHEARQKRRAAFQAS